MDSLTHLRQLYLFNNELTGILPEGLEKLTSLRKCILTCQALNVESPYATLLILYVCRTFIGGLGLEGNSIIGEVSEGICGLRQQALSDLWADCGGDEPDINCTCCTMCCPPWGCT